MDFDQLTIENQELIAQFSQSNAALLCAKRKSASLLQVTMPVYKRTIHWEEEQE